MEEILDLFEIEDITAEDVVIFVSTIKQLENDALTLKALLDIKITQSDNHRLLEELRKKLLSK